MVKVKIAGMFDSSIFQGVLLMDEAPFQKLFPSRVGYQYFLIEVPPASATAVADLLESKLAGFDAERVADRLASFLAVQNTYLSTFQALGGLGLLLGTIGLSTVMLRNVLERRSELALLRAVGFRDFPLAWLVLCENALLLGWGLATGAASALLAMLPHLLSTGADVPWRDVAHHHRRGLCRRHASAPRRRAQRPADAGAGDAARSEVTIASFAVDSRLTAVCRVPNTYMLSPSPAEGVNSRDEEVRRRAENNGTVVLRRVFRHGLGLCRRGTAHGEPRFGASCRVPAWFMDYQRNRRDRHARSEIYWGNCHCESYGRRSVPLHVGPQGPRLGHLGRYRLRGHVGWDGGRHRLRLDLPNTFSQASRRDSGPPVGINLTDTRVLLDHVLTPVYNADAES